MADAHLHRILFGMRFVSFALVLGLLAFVEAAGAQAPAAAHVEAAIRVPGLDAERFVRELSRRAQLELVLVPPTQPRSSRARLEIEVDAEKHTARVAFHDGESDAPALVVIARLAVAPGEAWLLSQAQAAIESFVRCEGSLKASLPEVLDPWSPEGGPMRPHWSEVLDPWLGCFAEDEARGASSDWPAPFGDPILEGEVLDPWLEAAYQERSIALGSPRPGVAPRRLNSSE